MTPCVFCLGASGSRANYLSVRLQAKAAAWSLSQLERGHQHCNPQDGNPAGVPPMPARSPGRSDTRPDPNLLKWLRWSRALTEAAAGPLQATGQMLF